MGGAGNTRLVIATDPAAVMTRERITEEHRLIEQTTADFMHGEVLPALARTVGAHAVVCEAIAAPEPP